MAKVLNAKITNIPWEDRPEGCFLPVWRYSKNPVIDRNVNETIERAFNSGFVPFKDGYAGVFRGDCYSGIFNLYVGFAYIILEKNILESNVWPNVSEL